MEKTKNNLCIRCKKWTTHIRGYDCFKQNKDKRGYVNDGCLNFEEDD